MSSFNIALSGLTAASTDLDVVSNNIANADTVGFKSSRAEFADVYAAGAVNLNQSSVGEGVRVDATAQQFTQGDITTTGSNLDLAISGDGFFTLQDAERHRVFAQRRILPRTRTAMSSTPPARRCRSIRPRPTADSIPAPRPILILQTAQSAPLATTTGTVDPESAGGLDRADRRRLRSDQSGHLQPVDLDHGVRLAGQRAIRRPFTSRRRRRPISGRVNMTVNGTVGRPRADSDLLQHRRRHRAGGRRYWHSTATRRPTARPPMNMSFNFGQSDAVRRRLRRHLDHPERLRHRPVQHGVHRCHRHRVGGVHQRPHDAAGATGDGEFSQPAGFEAARRHELGRRHSIRHRGAGHRGFRADSAASNPARWRARTWI